MLNIVLLHVNFIPVGCSSWELRLRLQSESQARRLRGARRRLSLTSYLPLLLSCSVDYASGTLGLGLAQIFLHRLNRRWTAYLCSGLPTFRLTYILAYLRSGLPTFRLTYVPAYLRSGLPTFRLTYVPAYLRSGLPIRQQLLNLSGLPPSSSPSSSSITSSSGTSIFLFLCDWIFLYLQNNFSFPLLIVQN